MKTDADFNDASTPHFKSQVNRYGFRCNYHYEDLTCYGGPDGGDCPSGRRRRSAPRIQEQFYKTPKTVNNQFSLADGKKCGPGWKEITSQKMCEVVANMFGLKFKLQRDNNSAITGCIATELFDGRENKTIGKAFCQCQSTLMKDTTEPTLPSQKVKLKRTKRQAGDKLLCANLIEFFY